VLSLSLIYKQYSHLDDEVEHVKADELKKAGFNEAEVHDMNIRLEKYAKNHGDPFIIVPFMFTCVFSCLSIFYHHADSY